MRNKIVVVALVVLVALAAVPAVAAETGHGAWVAEQVRHFHQHMMALHMRLMR